MATRVEGSQEMRPLVADFMLVDREDQETVKKDGCSRLVGLLNEPFEWLRMLCGELETGFVFAVILVYGFSQGFAASFFRVVSDYYWKDVQQVQPSAVQLYQGLYALPWILKPAWGLLTDVFPISGYKRRPYFVLAGCIGSVCALLLLQKKPPILFALSTLIGISTAISIADVTIDACIARNSIKHPALASDMQSLCGFCSSTGAILGYSSSGILVRILGAQGALALLTFPLAMLVALGFTLNESKTSSRPDRQVFMMVNGALRNMIQTMKCPEVWKPSLYMFLSIALSYSTHEGHFYWYTDPKAGPAFPKEFVGIIYAIGAVGSILGVILYQKVFKDYPFRTVLFLAQLLYFVSGMLDLTFVLRLNLRLGLPDYMFVVIEEMSGRIVSRLRWMPMMVLSTRLCPLGIEGTFFALLMCIDSIGWLCSKWSGSLALHLLKVTRTNFKNLWLAVLIRNILRISTLALIFLVPKAGPTDALLPSQMLEADGSDEKDERLQLVSMNDRA
ncbi:putative folate-biopterin transporter 6 [Nymphaea thermarum]|nr:putative folate-biopterin transporter 6 [Nymphaea thermarum]